MNECESIELHIYLSPNMGTDEGYMSCDLWIWFILSVGRQQEGQVAGGVQGEGMGRVEEHHAYLMAIVFLGIKSH